MNKKIKKPIFITYSDDETTSKLLDELNKLENPPKLIEYVNIIESLLGKKDVSINGATITSFQEINVVEKIKIGIEEKKEFISFFLT